VSFGKLASAGRCVQPFRLFKVSLRLEISLGLDFEIDGPGRGTTHRLWIMIERAGKGQRCPCPTGSEEGPMLAARPLADLTTTGGPLAAGREMARTRRAEPSGEFDVDLNVALFWSSASKNRERRHTGIGNGASLASTRRLIAPATKTGINIKPLASRPTCSTTWATHRIALRSNGRASLKPPAGKGPCHWATDSEGARGVDHAAGTEWERWRPAIYAPTQPFAAAVDRNRPQSAACVSACQCFSVYRAVFLQPSSSLLRKQIFKPGLAR